MKPYLLCAMSLALMVMAGCSSTKSSEMRYTPENLASPHPSRYEIAKGNRRAKLVDPVDQIDALNGLPATEIAKRTASTMALRQNLYANQGLRNDAHNADNTLDAPANNQAPVVVFQKNDQGEMMALMVDPATAQVVNSAKVEQGPNQTAAFTYAGSNGAPVTMNTGILMASVQEGRIISQGSRDAIDLEMYAEQANFQKDQMEFQRDQMDTARVMAGLGVANAGAETFAFSLDRINSGVNSFRQIIRTDPNAVYGGFQSYQGGTFAWNNFFTPNSHQFIGPR